MPEIGLRHVLLAILLFGTATLWVPERWALSALEAAACLAAAALALGVALGKRRAAGGAAVLPIAGMCLWAAVQIAAGWSAARVETADALLYWMAAASLVWLAQEACAARRDRLAFLKAASAAGAALALAGVVQLYTSNGKAFWLFPTGYQSRVIGPFVSANNYAVFVELLLPVSLALALTDRRKARAYLLVAAALAASVIASGSRAGAALVVAESVAVFLGGRRLRRTPAGPGRPPWVAFAAIMAAFTLVLGAQYVAQKVASDSNPYLVRRELLASTLAMARAEPLHGFGLGSWPSIYGQFAIIDTGYAANHAHNEWIQWAAEGGVPALALMAAALALTAPAAWRSLWGLGLLSAFAHSLVDYPFLRLGLAAWIFVWIGALDAWRRERNSPHDARPRPRAAAGPGARLLAGAAVAALVFGVLWCARLAWADALYRRATPEDVARAAELCPGRAAYQFALAELDPDTAVGRLEQAVALDPYFTRARMALAAELEMRGQAARSEAILLEGARRDRRYAPAWALANFYFRNGRMEPFWRWARAAAGMSYGDASPLFDLCSLAGGARAALDRVVETGGPLEPQYLRYLLERGNVRDAVALAARIGRSASEADRRALLEFIERAIEAGEMEAAEETWNDLSRRGVIPQGKAGRGLVDADFSAPISNRGFDWRLSGAEGVSIRRTREHGSALEIGLLGAQPESCELLAQLARLDPESVYALRFEYRTTDLPADTGLFWSLGAEQSQIAASEAWTWGECRFHPGSAAARLALAYRRLPGCVRTEGAFLLRGISLGKP